MTIEEFMATLCARTAIEYRSTVKYIERWEKEKPQFPTFSEYLDSLEALKPATRAKHIRHARTIAKKTGAAFTEPNVSVSAPPPGKFTDSDFQSLYGAFYGVEYPKFIISGQRHRYWHAVIHFAAVTALRRQAILGMEVGRVDFKEFYVTVSSETDKKGKERYKPITPVLGQELLELHRFIDWSSVPAQCRNRLFPWNHGDKRWYVNRVFFFPLKEGREKKYYQCL